MSPAACTHPKSQSPLIRTAIHLSGELPPLWSSTNTRTRSLIFTSAAPAFGPDDEQWEEAKTRWAQTAGKEHLGRRTEHLGEAEASGKVPLSYLGR